MSTFKGRGLVLKETNVGESDKIVTLLLKEHGKISASVKGARKPKSKFLAGTQIFTYCDFVIFDGGRFFSITQVEIIKNFYNLRNNFENLCYGNYFLEICSKTILESMPCDDILFLLLKSLQALCKDSVNTSLISSIFEIKFLHINGYSPELSVCSVCGNVSEFNFFGSHGVLCNKCLVSEEKVVKISSGTVYTLKYIVSSDINNLFKFKLSEDVLRELIQVTDLFMSYHINIDFKSKQMIKSI